MVPKGWEKTNLAHLISIKHGFAFKSEYFRETGEYILLTPGSFYEKGGFKDQKDKTKYYIGEIPNSYLLSKNDLLIAMTEQASGLLGSALFVPEQNIYLHNQRLGKVEIKAKELIDLNFLYLTFNSPLARKQISEQSTGTKVKHTSPDKLKSIICLLPPLPEQQKIAKILSTWDKAISTTERLIENSTQQKKALMQQLLTGKKRLLDDEGKMFEGEWKKVKLGELFNFSTASSKSKFIDNSGQNYILDMGSVTRDGKLKPTKKTLIDKDFLSKGQLIMPKDDIGGGQIIGRVGYVDENCKYILSDHVYCLTSKEGCSLFLSYLINSYPINKQIRRQANGTAQLGLGKKDAEKQTVTVPLELEEQQKIATVLTNADTEIELLEQQLANLQQEKKALMQVLLTGKKRVLV